MNEQKLNPCDDFWAWVCSSQKEVPRPRNSYVGVAAAKRYYATLGKWIKKTPQFQHFLEEQKRTQSSLMDINKDTVNENVDAFYKTNGKEGLSAHLLEHFVEDHLGDVYNDRTSNIQMNRFTGDWRDKIMKKTGKGSILIRAEGQTFTDLEGFKYDIKTLLSWVKKNGTDEEFVEIAKSFVNAFSQSPVNGIAHKIISDLKFQREVAVVAMTPEERKRYLSIYRSVKTVENTISFGTLDSTVKTKLNTIRLTFPTDRIIRDSKDPGFQALSSTEVPNYPGSLTLGDILPNITFLPQVLTQNADYNPGNHQLEIFPTQEDEADSSIYFTLAHESGHAYSDFVSHSKGKKAGFVKKIKNCLTSNTGGRLLKNEAEEGFADWYAANLFAEYLKRNSKKMSNIEQRRAIAATVLSCQEENLADRGKDVHPPASIRANNILMAQPYLRSVFGCIDKSANEQNYCGSISR